MLEDEAYRHNTDMDPYELSINTVSGNAMQAVVLYALWVKRHVKETLGGTEHITDDFDEMPEVRDSLDLHLDPLYDRSLAVRAVYARWFPWDLRLDVGLVGYHQAVS